MERPHALAPSSLVACLRRCCCRPADAAAQAAADKRPMKVDDLFRFKRVSRPADQPRRQARRLRRRARSTWTTTRPSPTSGSPPTDGKTPPKQLTDHGQEATATRAGPPTASTILFESTRSGDEPALGHRPRRRRGPAAHHHQHRGQRRHLVARRQARSPSSRPCTRSSPTKPFAESDKLNKKKHDEIEKGPVKAKVFTKLFYRHWDSTSRTSGSTCSSCPTTTARPASRATSPPATATPTRPRPRSRIGDDFTFSPDGKYLVFTAVAGEGRGVEHQLRHLPRAASTRRQEWETLTKDNPAADSGAAVLARRQEAGLAGPEEGRLRGGQVGDLRRRLRRRTATLTGKPQSVTGEARRARSTSSSGRPTARRIYFTADENGAHADLSSSADVPTGEADDVLERQHQRSPVASATDGKRWPSRARPLNHPAEVFVDVARPRDGRAARTSARPTTSCSASSTCRGRRASTVPVDGGTPMQMWILKPPGFDAKKKWPVAYLVHGGPQGAWEDGWSLPLEPAAVGRAGLRRRPAQPARLAPASARSSWTRSPATGAASATTTSMAGARLPREAALRGQGPHRPRPGRRSAAT